MSAQFERLSETGYALQGEVTVDTVPLLWPRIAPTAHPGGRLHVDCAGVTRADSAAVALLVEWKRQLRRHGGDLRVENLPEVMRVIMEVSDLDEIFDLEPMPSGTHAGQAPQRP